MFSLQNVNTSYKLRDLTQDLAVALVGIITIAEIANASSGVTPPLYLSIINFVIYLVVAKWLINKKVNPLLKTRGEKIRADIASAAVAKKASEAELSAAKARLAGIDTEIEQIRKQVEADIISIGDELRSNTILEKLRIDKDLQRKIASAQKSATAAIKSEILVEAEKILMANISSGISDSADRALRADVVNIMRKVD